MQVEGRERAGAWRAGGGGEDIEEVCIRHRGCGRERERDKHGGTVVAGR